MAQISKPELRTSCREKRAGASALRRETWNAAINATVEKKTRELGCETVAAYCAFDGEPDLTPVLNQLDQRGVRLVLPVLEAGSRAAMVLREWHPGADLSKNSFGIPEPVNTREVLLTEIDMVLMPLVGWDLQGNRLGMGAGYYDRLLEPVRNARQPLRVGVAFSIQKVAAIPADTRDVPMHALIDENGWTFFTN